MSGRLDGVRIGPWVLNDIGGGYCDALGTGSRNPTVAVAYPRGGWVVYSPAEVPNVLNESMSGGIMDAEACLRKLGAILPGDEPDAAEAEHIREIALLRQRHVKEREAWETRFEAMVQSRDAADAARARLSDKLTAMTDHRDRMQAANANLALRFKEQGDVDAKAQANDRKIAADLRERLTAMTAERDLAQEPCADCETTMGWLSEAEQERDIARTMNTAAQARADQWRRDAHARTTERDQARSERDEALAGGARLNGRLAAARAAVRLLGDI